MLKEPVELKQVAKRLETKLQGQGQEITKVGTGYALQSRLDPPEKAKWTLFVYVDNLDSVTVEPEFEGYPVQVRSVPRAYLQ